MRSLPLCFALLIIHLTTAVAQGPPLNGTPDQMFDAGMNALSGSAGTRNELAAVDYFRRSAQKNYGPAQVVLGYLYDTGLIVVRDPSQAADWYRKAADGGDPLAQWVLGRLYVMASGLPRDDAAAQKWLTLSARRIRSQLIFWEACYRSATTKKLRTGFEWPPSKVFRRRNTRMHGL